MSDTPNNTEAVETLLKEGIAAARLGDRDTARDRLHQAIEIDRNNEKAWFWLAAVVETIAERRQCLESVLLINPNNQRAQTLLDQIEQATHIVDAKTTSSNRSAMFAIAIGGAVLVGALFFAVLSISGGGGEDGADNESTAPAAVIVIELTPTPAGPPTETATPSHTPTITNTIPPRNTLPPLATSTPTPTDAPTTTPLPIVPPDNVAGQLFISSGGFYFSAPEYQQIFIIPMNDLTQRLQVTADSVRARMMNASPDADRFVTEQFNSGQDIITLQVLNINGTNSISLSRYWNQPVLSQQLMPRWSPNAPEIVFVGKTGFDRENDLYIVDISGDIDPEPIDYDPDDPEATPPPPPPITAMTNSDDVDETWPAWSPDGTRVVYVADVALTGTNGVDLRMLDVDTKDVYAITSDGLDVVESMPNWGGPDGNLIVYTAINPDGTSDIWLVDASQAYFLEEGPREPEVIATEAPLETPEAPPTEETPVEAATETASEEATAVATEAPTEIPTEIPTETATEIATEAPTEAPAEPVRISGTQLIDLGPQDIMPLWSPDGRYIVFSANNEADENDFDVYVYDYETGELFVVLQILDSREVAYDWFE